MEGLFYYRLRDSAGAWSGGNARFTPSNWCDYIIHYSGFTLLLEAKTTKGKSLPYSNLKLSQLSGFEKIETEKYEGVKGLFAIEFQDLKETFLIDSSYILQHIKKGERKSIEIAYVREHGVMLEVMKGKKVLMDIPKGLAKCI